ncbi:MAG TPA: enoyl-CoA hydratase-related protein [Candidatus Limnocylindrales bacterium]|nr:enoyl-CoA hydratase-related protein [Candidatus Limnocylindrales bacterium]
MTQTAPTESAQPAERSLVRLDFPAPTTAGPATGVALVTLDRPDVLNALSFDLLDELAAILDRLDADPGCRAIVLTGSGSRAFAAGADIRELARQTPVSLLVDNRFAVWDRIGAIRTPLIAAVRGFALGGGCELAMSCDIIVAAEDASFGQPEINLGVMPGAGGTQRLTRAIGKARAMDLVLTGRTIGAVEAERMGLVSRVVPPDTTLDTAMELATRIAAQAPVAVLTAKEAIRQAAELPLAAGLQHERRAFYLLFASDDQREGMAAFVEKRPPQWKGR